MNDSKLGQNQESIQASNKALLLELIREEGNCSRAFLAKKTGLQPTTVTYIINDFIKCGLVEETGLMFKNVYDTDDNGIVDGAESLHDEDSQIWFELS